MAQILDHVESATSLDVIAITDHERIDAAIAARAMASARGCSFEVVVGEEVTTRSGHLLALFIEEPIRPLQSLRATIGQVHEQGGLAIPAHPLTPVPSCASGRALRGLLASRDPRLQPDALEAFNPTPVGRYWHRRVVAFIRDEGLAGIGSSDAHDLGAIGIGETRFPGRTAEELRAAIADHRTTWHGSFHGTSSGIATFGRQLRKYGRDIRDEGHGLVLRGLGREHRGRDLGYPGGRLRPPRFENPEPPR